MIAYLALALAAVAVLVDLAALLLVLAVLRRPQFAIPAFAGALMPKSAPAAAPDLSAFPVPED